MAAARTFQDLIAWQLCSKLRDELFAMTGSGRCLADPEFREHIRRAATSAPRLIAEGFVRFTPDEFVRYLRMARGEIAEVQNELEYERTRKYSADEESNRARTLASRAMATTTALLKSKLPLLKDRQPRRHRS